jgi:hypothetical protein
MPSQDPRAARPAAVPEALVGSAALGPSRHPEHPLGPEIRDLLDRCTRLRRGLAFANRAPPELAAAALGVPPRVLDQARASLARPDERRLLVREYARALERRRREPPRSAARPEPPRRGPEDVIRDAERHPLGVQFLLCAPFETAAVTFGVHPDVVLAARQLLARRGVRPAER